MALKVCVISLGCPKNLIDAEHMLALLKGGGIEIVDEPAQCDVAVVNTCGFIEDAKKESIGAILELCRLRGEGKIRGVIAAGCLTQRYKDEFLNEFPEVSGMLGAGSYHEIVSCVRKVMEGGAYASCRDVDKSPLELSRVVTTPFYTSYLKIAEGCDNRCAYCVIPAIRGRFRSRRMEDVADEARTLAENGVKELIVVAQDTSRYGLDLYGRRMLPALLRQLCEIRGVEWIRLHYLYPDGVTDELLSLMAENGKLLPYFDIPFQHASDKVLKSMRRPETRAGIEALISGIRSRVPRAVLRTSLIVGLPGEGEREFSELCEFLEKVKIERAGVFCYSREEGTAAADMPFQVDEETKLRRQDIVLGIQMDVADACGAALCGKELMVLCEGMEQGLYVGRSYLDSPDIDGRVLFKSKKKCSEGEFFTVRINRSGGFDLYGERVD